MTEIKDNLVVLDQVLHRFLNTKETLGKTIISIYP